MLSIYLCRLPLISITKIANLLMVKIKIADLHINSTSISFRYLDFSLKCVGHLMWYRYSCSVNSEEYYLIFDQVESYDTCFLHMQTRGPMVL